MGTPSRCCAHRISDPLSCQGTAGQEAQGEGEPFSKGSLPFHDLIYNIVLLNSSPVLGLRSAGGMSNTVLQPFAPDWLRRKAARV